MSSRPWLLAVLLAVPGLALAGAGLFHPHPPLNFDNGSRWFWLHILGLPVFPLLGVALMVLVRGRADVVSWLIRVSAYVYATFYTALDVISGIGTGWLTTRPGLEARPDEVSVLFGIGTRLGEVGSYGLLVCCAIVAGDAIRRLGAPGLVALVMLPGAWLVHTDHIYSPGGVIGTTLIGLATGAVGYLRHRDIVAPLATRRGAEATSRAATAS